MHTATGLSHAHERRVAFDPKIAVAAVVPFTVGAAFAHHRLLLIDPLIPVTAFAVVFLASMAVSPFKRSYGPLGEIAMFLIYGPGVVLGTLRLFGGNITVDVVTAATCVGLLLANLFLVNEVGRPDPRTITAHLGRHDATTMFGFIYAAALSLPIIMFLSGGSVALLGLLAAVIPADYAVWALHAQRVDEPVAAEGAAMIACVAAAAGLIAILVLL